MSLVLAILSTGAECQPMEDRSQGRLRVHLIVLTVTGWPAIIGGLDGDLARLQQ